MFVFSNENTEVACIGNWSWLAGNVYISIAVASSMNVPHANVNACHCTVEYYLVYFKSYNTIILINIFVLTVRPCGTPSYLSNGQRSYTSTTVGSRVTYTCNTGYLRTAGSSSRTCRFGGRWSGSHPTCSSEFMLVIYL